MLLGTKKKCRICDSNKLSTLIDLGRLPLAGYFPEKKNLKDKVYKLKPYYCPECKFLQILDVINPDILFKKYNYNSSSIISLKNHFIGLAKKLKSKFKNKKKIKILEFGSNDGVLLEEFMGYKKYSILGVDPSKNISKVAKKKGIDVINKYFNSQTANFIQKNYGEFDLILACNVFAHIDDIKDVLDGVNKILKTNGQFIIEVHYLLDLLKYNQYDTIYHEHLSYYSLNSLIKLAKIKNLNIVDCEHIETHSGSIRVTFSKTLQNPSKNLKKFLDYEKKYLSKYLREFKKKSLAQKNSILKLIKNIKKDKKNVIGFGASGRGNIFLNYCGITKKDLNYIVDQSHLRFGKYIPCSKIPIYNFEYFKKNVGEIDYVLIIAWNYSSFIIKMIMRINPNIKFIIPFPQPFVIK